MSSISNTLSAGRQDGLKNYNVSVDDMKEYFELENILKKNIEKNYNEGYLKYFGDIFDLEDEEDVAERFSFKKKKYFTPTKKAKEDIDIILGGSSKARRKSQFIEETLNAKKKTDKKK